MPKYISSVGTFECVVNKPTGAWFAETSTGTPYIRIPLTVTEGPEKGATIIHEAWVTSKAAEGTADTLKKVFGWEWNTRDLAIGATCFAGLPCQVTTRASEYNGKTYYKTEWLNPPRSASPSREMPKDKLDALVAKLDALKSKTSDPDLDGDGPGW